MKLGNQWLQIFLGILFTAPCKSNRTNYRENVPSLLRDFIQLQDVPPQVFFISCYKIETLMNVVSSIPSPISVVKSDELVVPENVPSNHVLFVTDLHCPNSTHFLENSVNPNYYRHPFRWFIIKPEDAPLPEVNSLPDSNIFVAIPKLPEGHFRVIQFYKVEINTPVIMEPFGSWSLETNFIVSQKDKILSRRRRDLRGKLFTASLVILNNDTLNHLEDYENKNVDSIAKHDYLVTKALVQSLNSSLKVICRDTWGYQNPSTKQWSGMMGDIIKAEAELGGTSLFITAPRVPHIDYLSMVTPTRAGFIFREPPLSYVSNIFSLPFTGVVWICCAGLVALSVFVILVTIKFQQKYQLDENEKTNVRLSDFLLLGISIVCQMGSFVHPKTVSARISTIFLLIAILFLYTSYTANIVALLQSTTKTIQTLSDLLKSQVKVGVEDTPYNRYYFETATEPVRKAIYQTKVLSSKGVGNYMNVSRGVSLVREGLFAFHSEGSVSYKGIEDTFYEHEKCNLMFMPYIQVVDPWYAIAKRSPYKEMIKVRLFQLREFGLQSAEYQRLYTKKPVCAAAGQSFGSVRLTDCYAAIVVLLIGYVLAILILFLEKLCPNCKLGYI